MLAATCVCSHFLKWFTQFVNRVHYSFIKPLNIQLPTNVGQTQVARKYAVPLHHYLALPYGPNTLHNVKTMKYISFYCHAVQLSRQGRILLELESNTSTSLSESILKPLLTSELEKMGNASATTDLFVLILLVLIYSICPFVNIIRVCFAIWLPSFCISISKLLNDQF